MANSSQAIKRVRQQEKRRLHNTSQKSAVRTAIKRVLSAIKTDGKEAAQAAFKSAVVSIDRLAGRKVIHANKAARLKGRLNKKIQEAGK